MPVAGSFGYAIPIQMLDGGSALDISGATTLEIKLRDPCGTNYGPFTAVLTTDGLDGRLRYVVLTGDIPSTALPGTWERRARAVGAGYDLETVAGTFEIEEAW